MAPWPFRGVTVVTRPRIVVEGAPRRAGGVVVPLNDDCIDD